MPEEKIELCKSKKIWQAIGGRKFLGLVLAIAATIYLGTLDEYLRDVFIVYMVSNAMKDIVKIDLTNKKE